MGGLDIHSHLDQKGRDKRVEDGTNFIHDLFTLFLRQLHPLITDPDKGFKDFHMAGSIARLWPGPVCPCGNGLGPFRPQPAPRPTDRDRKPGKTK